MEFKNFKDILNAILNKTIDYGRDKEYYLFLTEDRDLCFLKRNQDTPPEGFINEYSGEEIYALYSIDWETYTLFMRSLNIETNTY